MAKVQIKSEKLTPFGGIFSIMEQFDALLAQTIDSTLGLRCTMFGYQYSEILRSLMCVYLCGGSCIEDVTTHLMKHLSLHPTLRTCSADTILRAIEELTCEFELNSILVEKWKEKSYRLVIQRQRRIEGDLDITQACIEHLLRQQYLCQPVQDRLWLKAMLFWLNRRITSSRFMG